MGLIGRPRKIAINWNYSGRKAKSVLCKSRLGFNSWSVKVVKTITENENKMRAAFDDEERSGCVAHILHSSITEGYKKITEVKEVIEKNRKIATKYHKSYAFKYSLEEEQKKRELPVRAILQDVPTRWGSTRSSTGSFLDKEEKGMEAEVKLTWSTGRQRSSKISTKTWKPLTLPYEKSNTGGTKADSISAHRRRHDTNLNSALQ